MSFVYEKGVIFEQFVKKFRIVEVLCSGDIVFILRVICEMVEGGFCMSIFFMFGGVVLDDIIILYFVIQCVEFLVVEYVFFDGFNIFDLNVCDKDGNILFYIVVV